MTFTQSQVNLQTTAIKATATAGKGVGSFEISKAYEAAGGTANVNNTGTAGSAGTTAVGQNGAVNTTSNGGAGGTGITPTGKVAQSSNGQNATANALTTTGGMLNVMSDSGLTIAAKAENAAELNSAKAVTAVKSDSVYAVKGDFTVTATAAGDVNSADYATDDGGTTWTGYKAAATNTKTDATGFTINGGSMIGCYRQVYC